MCFAIKRKMIRKCMRAKLQEITGISTATVNDAKHIGLDVHQATISATVLDSTGNLVMESVLEAKAATILQFVHGLRGSLHVAIEE